MPAAVVKVSYVLRTQPKNMNNNAEFSLEQQTILFVYRFPILMIIFLTIVRKNDLFSRRLWAKKPRHSGPFQMKTATSIVARAI